MTNYGLKGREDRNHEKHRNRERKLSKQKGEREDRK